MILFGSGIQPENALKILEKGWKLTYFTYEPDIKEWQKKAEDLLKKLNISYFEQNKNVKLTKNLAQIQTELTEYIDNINKIQTQIDEKDTEIQEIQEQIIPINHLKNIDINLQDLYNLKYINFRYGKILQENYQEMKTEIEKMKVKVIELEADDKYLWILYFMPDSISEKVDSFFKVMKFERVWLSDDIKGKPIDFINQVNNFIENNNEIIEKYKQELASYREKIGKELQNNYYQLKLLEKVNKIKKYMAHDNKGAFYFVGWIPEDNLKKLIPKLKKDEIEYTIKSHDEVASTPPTKLKNIKLVKPFESIVKMYGIPNYTETDPSIFVAITAFLMFGFMFVDIGQGAVILIIGLILKKMKKSLGSIFVAGGISAIIFGFLYGSIFGKEDIIKGILPSPMDNITNMLIAGMTVGAILIIVAMILNIKNGITNKDKGKIFFDKNGLAGLVFYVSVLVLIIGYLLKGKMLISLGLSLALIIIPLLLILFKDNLEKIIDKKKTQEKSSIVEKIFELIEMLLNIASNTISFVRLAAFAINHVGLCMAIYILSDMFGSAGSIIVGIIGNIIVIALEGLIVAIQVLRLEYYELFSRFYSGDGKEYIPLEEEK